MNGKAKGRATSSELNVNAKGIPEVAIDSNWNDSLQSMKAFCCALTNKGAMADRTTAAHAVLLSALVVRSNDMVCMFEWLVDRERWKYKDNGKKLPRLCTPISFLNQRGNNFISSGNSPPDEDAPLLVNCKLLQLPLKYG